MLVLNATYEPVNVCTVRRAVVLLLKEKAEVIERARGSCTPRRRRSPRPMVIRLVTFVKVPRDTHRRKITRRAVFARDGWQCQYCGSRANLTVDHVIPRSKGGDVDVGEHRRLLRAVQPPQGRQPAREAGMHPKRKPRAPHPQIFIHVAAPTSRAAVAQYLASLALTAARCAAPPRTAPCERREGRRVDTRRALRILHSRRTLRALRRARRKV